MQAHRREAHLRTPAPCRHACHASWLLPPHGPVFRSGEEGVQCASRRAGPPRCSVQDRWSAARCSRTGIAHSAASSSAGRVPSQTKAGRARARIKQLPISPAWRGGVGPPRSTAFTCRFHRETPIRGALRQGTLSDCCSGRREGPPLPTTARTGSANCSPRGVRPSWSWLS